MNSYSRSHLSDGTLLSNAHAHLSQDRTANAELLANLAEIEERRVYASAGFCSMRAYCLEELHLSDDEAEKRIHAARAARKCPAIFPALAEGRLHMTAVNLLAPHLTAEGGGRAAGGRVTQEQERDPAHAGPAVSAPGRARPGTASWAVAG